MKEGGSVSTSVGNADYLKVQGLYSTGLMDFSASVLLSSTTGDGYVDGTKFEGKIFYCFGYKPNDKHDLQFTFTELLNGTTKEVLLIHYQNILNMVLTESQILNITLTGC
jgi:hypothetical protein